MLSIQVYVDTVLKVVECWFQKMELKVSINCCDGCKRKVKKVLQSIEGNELYTEVCIYCIDMKLRFETYMNQAF